MSNQPFVLKATLGPPNKTINFLYSETPMQENYLVRVKRPESALRLMKVSYVLVEDPTGQIDSGKMPLSPKEAADFIGIAQSTVYKYIKNWEDGSEGHQLEARKDGDEWKISRAAAESLKQKLKNEG